MSQLLPNKMLSLARLPCRAATSVSHLQVRYQSSSGEEGTPSTSRVSSTSRWSNAGTRSQPTQKYGQRDQYRRGSYNSSNRSNYGSNNYSNSYKSYNNRNSMDKMVDNTDNMNEQGRVYEAKRYNARLPFTTDEATKVLMNWNFVEGDEFLRSLRNSLIIYGKLTEKQMEALRNKMMSKHTNKYLSPFRAFVRVDPVVDTLLAHTAEEFDEMKKEHPQFSERLQDFQQKLAANGYLTHKQLKFVASMLYQVYGSEQFDQKQPK